MAYTDVLRYHHIAPPAIVPWMSEAHIGDKRSACESDEDDEDTLIESPTTLGYPSGGGSDSDSSQVLSFCFDILRRITLLTYFRITSTCHDLVDH